MTSRQADKLLLQSLLSNTNHGSTSVRNNNNNQSSGVKVNGPPPLATGPFFAGGTKGSRDQAKIMPGSTKGSQTNRFQNNLSNNMLYELI